LPVRPQAAVHLPVCQFPDLPTHADHFYVEVPSQTWQNDDTGRLLDGAATPRRSCLTKSWSLARRSTISGTNTRLLSAATFIVSSSTKRTNPQSYTKTSEAILQLEPDKKHLITTMPMPNMRNGFYSYLTTFWKDEWNVDLAKESINASQFDPSIPLTSPSRRPSTNFGAR
jgi:hypothetical protein